ncbi:MAG: ABC transporter ATP-binding protein [Actinomycetia bacterium]|nr:ABC transporter ATP-binding protein [Actinomycetes bacterium]
MPTRDERATVVSAAPAAGAVSGRIEIESLTKVFNGRVRAVDQLSFTVEPGSVTGFLGPNGAGKTTTLRMILGLVRPTAGRATIGGRPYHRIPDPMHVVGAALEASSFHPARTARNHLRILCAAAHLPDRRADEVLDLVGLRDAARRKVRGYSMGMRQRLGLAATLLGDPQVLILDEPANGLDPEGIRWLRGFFLHLAGEGRTVLISSHQLAEVQEFADRVVILSQGRLVRAGSIDELTAGTGSVVVAAPEADRLAAELAQAGLRVLSAGPEGLRVATADAARVGHLAFAAGVELHELRVERFDLEQLFFSLTEGQFPGAQLPAGPPPGALSAPAPPGGFGSPTPQGGAPWSA